ncbi:MAG: 50S ribosomal protein L9 [Pseudomonadota bacterium]
MEVILLERIARLGAIGETVKVRNGYGRNFLIPMKKALRATEENKKIFEERRHIIEEKNNAARKEAEVLAKKVEGISVKLIRQASQEGKLYGSVTVRDIADALKEAGHVVPKSQIIQTTIIKTIGEYPVRVILHPEVIANVKLDIVRVEADAA